MGPRCECYTQQATLLQVNADTCRQIVKFGYFVDWKKQQEAPPPVQRAARDQAPAVAAQAQPPVVINLPAGQQPQQQSAYLEALAARNAQVRSACSKLLLGENRGPGNGGLVP